MESILDHLNVPVKETARAKAFYVAALAPLGISLVVEVADERGSSCGFGAGAFPELWVGDRLPSYQVPADRERLTPLHVALRARSRAQVDAFHRAALAAGGRDLGAPGLRGAGYPPGYYAAFVLDLDGHNLEAVCRGDDEADERGA
jgi:catechol 2,3-dioxygenase-like lactoylglutathione lyase family enzyme